MKFKKAGMLTKLLILALVLYAIVSIVSINNRRAEAEAQRAELQEQADRMTSENAELEYQLEHSEDDETIEEIARNKLGLVLPGEKVFYDISD